MIMTNRYWAIDENGEWNDVARSLDLDFTSYSNKTDNETVLAVKDLLSTHKGLRELILFVYKRRLDEIDDLVKENRTLRAELLKAKIE